MGVLLKLGFNALSEESLTKKKLRNVQMEKVRRYKLNGLVTEPSFFHHPLGTELI